MGLEMAIASVQFPTSQGYSDLGLMPSLGTLGKAFAKPQMLADLGQRYQDQSTDPTSYTAPRTTTPDTTPRASFDGDKQGVAKTVASELKAQGFSDNAIAGILYNIGQESSFDPTLRHPDQPRFGGEAHYAHGLFQEGGDEWNTMQANLQGRDWQDPVEQARFVAGRLKGDIGNAQYASVLRDLQNAKSKEDAARVFASGYLKPADQYLQSRYSDISRGIPGVGFYTGE
jgi:hypothetical protein